MFWCFDLKHTINVNIIKANRHEFKVSDHQAHREAFSKNVLQYHTHSSTLNIKQIRRALCWRGILKSKQVLCFNVLSYFCTFSLLLCGFIFSYFSTLTHIRSIMFEDLCSFLSKKKKLKLQTTFNSIESSSIYWGFISCHLKLYFSASNTEFPFNCVADTTSNWFDASFKLCLEHINQWVFNKQYKYIKSILRWFSNKQFERLARNWKKIGQNSEVK